MEQRLQELKEKIYMFCGVPKEKLYEKEIPITAMTIQVEQHYKSKFRNKNAGG